MTDGTVSFDKDYLVFVAPNPQQNPKYLALIQPLQPEVWALLLLSLVGGAAALLVVARGEQLIFQLSLPAWNSPGDAVWYCASLCVLVSAVVQVCVRNTDGGVHHAGPELGRGHRAPPRPVRLDPVLPHAGCLLQRQSQGLPHHARLQQTDQLAGGGEAPPLLSLAASLCGGAGGGERAALGDGALRGGGGGDDGKQSARLSRQNNLGQEECR